MTLAELLRPVVDEINHIFTQPRPYPVVIPNIEEILLESVLDTVFTSASYTPSIEHELIKQLSELPKSLYAVKVKSQLVICSTCSIPEFPQVHLLGNKGTGVPDISTGGLNIDELDDEHLSTLFETHPNWVAAHRFMWVVKNRLDWVVCTRADWTANYQPEWLAMSHPVLMSELRPDYMSTYHPAWMSLHHPNWMASTYPELIAEHRPEWLASNRPDVLRIYKPNWKSRKVPKAIMTILALEDSTAGEHC